MLITKLLSWLKGLYLNVMSNFCLLYGFGFDSELLHCRIRTWLLLLIIGDLWCRFLLNKTIDVLLYVDRLDAYRVDDLDRQIIKAVTGTFGKQIWRKSLLVLTHAQLCPPDGLNYDVYCSKRSDALLKTIRVGAGLGKHEFEVNFSLLTI